MEEDGKPIRTVTVDGRSSAFDAGTVATVEWRDYHVWTRHYVVAALKAPLGDATKAAFPNAFNYENPLRFRDQSCFGGGSDCQIVPLGGERELAEAAIYLGGTQANQRAVNLMKMQLQEPLGREQKAEVLRSVFQAAANSSDDFLIDAINLVASKGDYPEDLLASALEEVARAGTLPVRRAACAVMKRKRHPCSKAIWNAKLKVRIPAKPPHQAGAAADPELLLDQDPLGGKTLPKYLVYRLFMNMFLANY